MNNLVLSQAEHDLLMVCLAIAQREFIAKLANDMAPMWKDIGRRDAQAVANLIMKLGG